MACRVCGGPMPPAAATGRPAQFCSAVCRNEAYVVRKGLGALTGSGGRLPTVEELEERFFAGQLEVLEARREAKLSTDRRAAEAAAKAAGDEQAFTDLHNATIGREWNRTGMPGFAKAFADWLRDGKPPRDFAGVASKASIVEDATGQVLIPSDLSVDILNVAVKGVRSLVSVRPTTRNKHQARLLDAAATGWGRLETGTTATDADVAPESPGQEIEVHDLVSLALIGVDELADAPDNVQSAIVESIGSAIADAEVAAFAAGTGSGQPKGISLAANVARVPAAQKIAVGASNTPTAAQLATVPFLVPDRHRDAGTWLMHPTSAGKILPLVANFEPGPLGRGLLGWPVRVLSSLPDPATAGTGDASIWFGDWRSAYRLADRQRTTVQVLRQRYAELGLVGLLVRHRVGGDLVRPAAVAVYTQ